MPKPTSCIFCGKTDGPFDKEEIIPKWIARDFPKAFIELKRGSGQRISVNRGHFGLVTRLPCRTCNNEFLGNIEDRAKPILRPLILGKVKSGKISETEQLALAAWLYKTALLADLSETKRETGFFFTADDARVFYASFEMPCTPVFLLASLRSRHVHFRIRPRHLVGDAAHPLGGFRAHSFTLGLLSVVLQLFAVRRTGPPLDRPLPPVAVDKNWLGYEVMIPADGTVALPRRQILAGEGFENYAKRWSRFRWITH